MLNFRKIYEWIFSSFRIEGSGILMQTLRRENITQCMIIRRSLIFGVYVSFLLLLICAISWVQVSLVLQYPLPEHTADYVLVGLVTVNIIFILYSDFLYLFYFYKLHIKGNPILDMREAETAMHQEAIIFARFFNQITFSYLFIIILALLEIGYLLFVSQNYSDTAAWSYVISLCAQIVLIAYYRRRMIDLDMDYVVIVPGKLYFTDQVGVHLGNQTLKLMKDILIVKGGYQNLVGSFLNYGTIEISAKFDQDISAYDTPDILNMFHMHYVLRPIQTANDMNEVLARTPPIAGV